MWPLPVPSSQSRSPLPPPGLGFWVSNNITASTTTVLSHCVVVAFASLPRLFQG